MAQKSDRVKGEGRQRQRETQRETETERQRDRERELTFGIRIDGEKRERNVHRNLVLS